MIITFWFRKRVAGAHSIELIFETLRRHIISTHTSVQQILPFPSNSIWNILRNQFFVYRRSDAAINHITGDAHYVAIVLRERKTVLTIHDCVMLNSTPKSTLKHHVFLWLWYKLPIWKSDAVTTISEKSKSEIIAYTGCSPDKIRVIPNFVPPAFKAALQPFNTACPRILHIGVTPNKNLDRLIPALAGIPCILEIIGNLSATFQDLLHQHQISFENYQGLSAAEIIARYQAADIIVFVSTYEGFGMPIIEGQATGRPVVTSNFEPMTSVAGPEGACFVNPFDPMDIRAGLQRVIQDESYRNTLIENGLENVKRFTLDAVAQQYLELYETLSPHHVRHHRHPQSSR